jgi:hypothetical protein
MNAGPSGVGLSSRPLPALQPGEAIVRRYVASVGQVQAADDQRRSVGRILPFAVIGGLAAVFVVVGLEAGTSPELVGAFVAILLVFGLAVPIWRRVSGDDDEDDIIPDVAYLTTRRVVLDVGQAWESMVSTPLPVVSDVTIWQDSGLRRKGLAWVYVLPQGATRVEVMSEGELVPAPGVLRIRNLTARDAEEFRSETLRRAQEARFAAGFAPPGSARSVDSG